MDTSPAPHSALMRSQRLAVNTRQSNSGLAKLSRADFCGLPDLAAASASASADWGVRTSRTSVFILLPPDVAFKVFEQFVQC